MKENVETRIPTVAEMDELTLTPEDADALARAAAVLREVRVSEEAREQSIQEARARQYAHPAEQVASAEVAAAQRLSGLYEEALTRSGQPTRTSADVGAELVAARHRSEERSRAARAEAEGVATRFADARDLAHAAPSGPGF